MKKGLGISGMKRPLLGVTGDAPQVDAATPMARRGIVISGAGRRLGISGMNRPLIAPPIATTATTATTDDTDGDLLP